MVVVRVATEARCGPSSDFGGILFSVAGGSVSAERR